MKVFLWLGFSIGNG